MAKNYRRITRIIFLILHIVVAVLFWLLTKFRDSNRGGR